MFTAALKCKNAFISVTRSNFWSGFFTVTTPHLPVIMNLIITRGVQKVRSLTQLTTRYAHHILSLFNIDPCNWNALGPAYLQSSDPVVEELLFLVFQPAMCCADNVLVVGKFCVFQFRKKQKSLGARTTHLITAQLKHWLSSKIPALNYSVTHRIRHSCSYCTANGWLEGQEQQFFYNRTQRLVHFGAMEMHQSAFQLQVSMLKSDKIWCAYLVVNWVRLQTFWTPLVCLIHTVTLKITNGVSRIIRQTKQKISILVSPCFLRSVLAFVYHINCPVCIWYGKQKQILIEANEGWLILKLSAFACLKTELYV